MRTQDILLNWLGFTTTKTYNKDMQALLNHIKTLEKEIKCHEHVDIERNELLKNLLQQIDLLKEIKENDKNLLDSFEKENELLRACAGFKRSMNSVEAQIEEVSSL